MPLTGTGLIGGKANALECQQGHQHAQGRCRADRQIDFAGDNTPGFANFEHNTNYSSSSIRLLAEANSHISPDELGGFPLSLIVLRYPSIIAVMEKTRVLLAGEHAVVRAGIGKALGELDGLEIIEEWTVITSRINHSVICAWLCIY